MISKATLILGVIVLIVVAVAVVRFLVHALVQFVEISVLLAAVIIVLAWLVARRSREPGASRR